MIGRPNILPNLKPVIRAHDLIGFLRKLVGRLKKPVECQNGISEFASRSWAYIYFLAPSRQDRAVFETIAKSQMP